MTRRPDADRGTSRPPVPLSRARLFVVFAGMLALASMTFLRLLDLQIFQHADFVDRAQVQYTNKRLIEPERGLIYDRRGNALVTNLPNHWSVGVRPSAVSDPDALANRLATAMGLPEQDVRRAIARRAPFVWVERKVDARTAQEVRSLGFREVGLERETLRSYPYGRTGGQIVGYVDVDNEGRAGIEGLFDPQLSGRPGWEVVQKDAWRREILDPSYPRLDPVHGGKVVLSIDINAQAIAEEELEKVVTQSRAAGGMIVVTRPATGEVLAVASSPRYDPNDPGLYGAGARKNRAVTDVYEPGSTFKVVPMAGLIERGLVDIDEPVWCENGLWRIADRTIRDTHPNGWLTARQVLSRSSNIGMAKITDRLTARELYTIMRDFGFGQDTGVPLNGEAGGILRRPSEWSGVSMANMAMGHGIAVTSLQLAMAYGAIANDGLLLKPLLVLSVTDQDGNITLHETETVRRVLSPSTARTMRRLLTDAVELGTGHGAMIEGLQVAGKTGTAQKVDMERGTYYQDRYVASFAGFLPAERPELLAVVVVDDPQDGHYGGELAAPVFRRVMKRLLVTLPRRQPLLPGDDAEYVESRPSGEQGSVMPSVVALKREDAARKLERLGLRAVFVGEGEIVRSQQVPPGTALARGDHVELNLSGPGMASSRQVAVPDVRGLALRQAVATLSREGLRVKVQGSGLVVSQSLRPGRKEAVGTVCVIQARPAGKGA